MDDKQNIIKYINDIIKNNNNNYFIITNTLNNYLNHLKNKYKELDNDLLRNILEIIKNLSSSISIKRSNIEDNKKKYIIKIIDLNLTLLFDNYESAAKYILDEIIKRIELCLCNDNKSKKITITSCKDNLKLNDFTKLNDFEKCLKNNLHNSLHDTNYNEENIEEEKSQQNITERSENDLKNCLEKNLNKLINSNTLDNNFRKMNDNDLVIKEGGEIEKKRKHKTYKKNKKIKKNKTNRENKGFFSFFI